MGGDSHDHDERIKNTVVDYHKKHPLYEIHLDKLGPEFSQIDEKRVDFIRKYAGKLTIPEPPIPRNIQGLRPRTGPLPSNRRLWPRPSSAFQRNGIFYFHSPNFNTRILYPVFFVFLLYGWWGHPTYGYYKMKQEDNMEFPGNVYDKLNTRVPPVSKIWLRPG